jgi:hypothetical protein
MNAIIAKIVMLLKNSGLTPVEIVRFIQDVFNILDEGTADMNSMSGRLSQLGWPTELLNEDSFNLILHIYESGNLDLISGCGWLEKILAGDVPHEKTV